MTSKLQVWSSKAKKWIAEKEWIAENRKAHEVLTRRINNSSERIHKEINK